MISQEVFKHLLKCCVKWYFPGGRCMQRKGHEKTLRSKCCCGEAYILQSATDHTCNPFTSFLTGILPIHLVNASVKAEEDDKCLGLCYPPGRPVRSSWLGPSLALVGTITWRMY